MDYHESGSASVTRGREMSGASNHLQEEREKGRTSRIGEQARWPRPCRVLFRKIQMVKGPPRTPAVGVRNPLPRRGKFVRCEPRSKGACTHLAGQDLLCGSWICEGLLRRETNVLCNKWTLWRWVTAAGWVQLLGEWKWYADAPGGVSTKQVSGRYPLWCIGRPYDEAKRLTIMLWKWTSCTPGAQYWSNEANRFLPHKDRDNKHLQLTRLKSLS